MSEKQHKCRQILSTRNSPEAWLEPHSHIRALSSTPDFSDMHCLLSAPFLPPQLKLSLECVRNGHILLEQGQDGVAFDDRGKPLAATLSFRNNARALPEPSVVLNDARALNCAGFIGVDPAWGNYYHWLCLALPRMKIAQAELTSEVKFLLPDMLHALRLVTLETFGLDKQVALLQPGIYRVAELWRLSIDHEQSALLSCIDVFRQAYEGSHKYLHDNQAMPKRIFVTRARDPRIAEAHFSTLTAILASSGFVTLDLERMEFLQQAEYFHNADVIVAAHGAGLSNLVFGRSGLRVLELNDYIDGEPYLRPWFYYLSRAFEHDYSYINLSRQQPTPASWSETITRFLN